MEIYNSEQSRLIDQLIAEHGIVISAFVNWKRNINPAEIVERFEQHFCGHWDDEIDFAKGSSEVLQKLNWKQFSENFPFWSDCIDWEEVTKKIFEKEYHFIWVNEYDSDSWGIWVFRNTD